MAKLMFKKEEGKDSGTSAPKQLKVVRVVRVAVEGPAKKGAPVQVDPVLLGEVRKLKLGINSNQARAFWQGKIRDSKAVPPLTQEAAIGLLLETKSEDGIFIGWSLLRQNLKHIIIPMANNPSAAKVKFLVKAVKSNPPIAVAAFKAAAASRPISAKIITIAKEMKAKEAELAKDEYTAPVLSAAVEFLEVDNLMNGIAKGLGEQLAAMDQLFSMYASDHGKRFGYLADFLIHRRARSMRFAIEGKKTIDQEHAISVLRLFEKHKIVVDGTKEHVRIAVDALLEKGPEGWKGVLVSKFSELAPLIATSNSLNKGHFLASVVKGCEPALVSRALDLVFMLEQVPAEVVKAAMDVKDDPRVKSISIDFLQTLQLLQALEKSGDQQFAAAEALVKKARLDKPGFRMVLHELGAEMKDVSMEPAGPTPEEMQHQKDSAERVLAMLAKAGIDV